MAQRRLFNTLFPQNENPNVEPFDPDEELSPEESEDQQVNLGELGNYFDIVRNNYFEANRVLFIVGPITWDIGIRAIQKLAF